MTDEHKGFYRFRRKLAAGYIALGLLLCALLAWKTIGAYRSSDAAARSVTAHSATAVAAHVAELIDAVDQPLQNSAAAIAAMGQGALTANAVKPLLAASSLASDSRFWLLFIDASGRGVVASNGLRVAGVSFADRPYFSKQVANAPREPYIGAPTIGRVSQRRVFFLSRRVESPVGKLLGVVAAPVVASRLADVFESARLEPSMSVVLATADYKIVARAPLFERSFGADLTQFIAAAKAPFPASGSFAAVSPVQGDQRIFSYARVGKYPLVVAVGLGRAEALALIRNDFIVGALCIAMVLIIGWLSARLALAQYWRLEQSDLAQKSLIRELAHARDELSRGERRIRMIADNLPANVGYINVDERFTYHNSNSPHGAPLRAAMGKTAKEVFGPELYDQLKGDLHRALGGQRVCVEHSRTINGVERYFRHQYTPDIGLDGRVAGVYSMVTDITDFKQVQKTLSAIARVDSLTGLPNRAELLDQMESALARCRRSGTSLACLYLDIDRFKEINDTLGHAAGDAALIEFGRRLRSSVRETDLVARLAGDEFVILLEGLEQPGEGERVADKILEAMREPFDIEGARRAITTSIGVAIARPLDDSPRTLLCAGDAALYRAKREGRDRVCGEEGRNERVDGICSIDI